MKKSKVEKEKLKDISEDSDMKLSEKILDLCLWYQIEDSNNWIRVFESEIKAYEAEKRILLENCMFWFQKKKVYKEIEKIDEKIFKLYEKIGEV